MLRLLRKKIVMKIVLWGLVIIVVPAFVMWGGASSSRSKDKGPGYVGIVNNRKVPFDELGNAISGVRGQIILNYFNQPKVLDALLNNKPMMAKLAWDRILMLEEVKGAGIKTSDKEVIETLQKHPLFLRNGAFDDKFYMYILRNNVGLEARDFEEIVRENISLQKLSSSLTKDVKLSDEEAIAEYNKDFQKIKIAYILLEPNMFIDKVKAGENAAKDFYEKHKAELMIKSNLKGAIPDRQATFEESKGTIENYLREAEARAMLKEKANEVYAQISDKIGGTAEAFRKAAAKLGFEVKDTDFFSQKDTVEAIGDVPVIAEASYGLKENELSKPIEITKGYVIFEVTGKKDADKEAFEKDKEEYSKKVKEMRANAVLGKWLKGVEDNAKLAIKLEETDKYYQ